jgi:hypothetical protein
MAPVFLPGSKIHGSVVVGARRFPFCGEVAWARPGDLRRRDLSRVGIRFLETSGELASLLASRSPPAPARGGRVSLRRRRAA